ncbi:hypothetical protein Ddye_030783 [Dipteronia dyeriana]|uniref:Uncharacterized protein n=1 Tax=Dipteronia dyeriana TaxID=168575 RepID=A0AAD9THQ3_9ROSI|nr:hypothetical protein Ddye_030783 [Dipteronia dyeriana]
MDSNEVDNNNFVIDSESMEEEYDGDTQVENTGGDTSKEKKVVQSKPSRKRKETSKVWNVFVKLPRGKDGRLRCKCKGCSKTYLCKSIHGTEWSWIRRLIEYLCDDVTLVSRNTAKADVLRLFSKEKQKIKTMLENTPDPRYKMTFGQFAYRKVYGIDSLELDIVRSKLLS